MNPPEPLRLAYDRLQVEIHADEAHMGAAAAHDAASTLRHAIDARGTARIVLATGTSQLPFFRGLRDQQGVAWDKVTAFHMDEYLGIDADHPASFRAFLQEHIIGPLGIGTFHGIDGDPSQADATLERYGALLEEAPIDLVCMGIGENGHLAFNDPPDARFDDPLSIRRVRLDDVSRQQQVGEGHFPTFGAVPEEALTLTIPRLLRADRIQVVVPERRKAVAVERALAGPIDPSCPASILRTAPNATLYLDRDAAHDLDLA